MLKAPSVPFVADAATSAALTGRPALMPSIHGADAEDAVVDVVRRATADVGEPVPRRGHVAHHRREASTLAYTPRLVHAHPLRASARQLSR
jgi:hypothetical protein